MGGWGRKGKEGTEVALEGSLVGVEGGRDSEESSGKTLAIET